MSTQKSLKIGQYKHNTDNNIVLFYNDLLAVIML